MSTDLVFKELVGVALKSDEIREAASEASLTDGELRQAISDASPRSIVEPELTALRAARERVSVIRREVDKALRGVYPITLDVGQFRFTLSPASLAVRSKRQELRRREALELARGIQSALAAVARAEDQLRSGLYERAILAPLRRFIEASATASWSSVLTIDDAPGLAEIAGVVPVATDMVAEVATRIRHMPGGSIGISGPRGVGKTTLMRRFTSSRSEPRQIGVRVSAPTKYDGREFVLHLFAALCDEVERVSGEFGRSDDGPMLDSLYLPSSPAQRLFRALPLGLVIFGCGLVVEKFSSIVMDWRYVAGLACLSVSAVAWYIAIAARDITSSVDTIPEKRLDDVRAEVRRRRIVGLAGAVFAAGVGLIVISQVNTRTPVWVWGFALLLFAYGWQFWEIGVRRILFKPYEEALLREDALARLATQARIHANGIRFQQTIVTGWAATAKAPIAEGSITASRSLQEIPQSFPQLTDTLTEFIELVSEHAQVVIGIDELDKMDADETSRFLNDIKGIFGVRKCFFFVSVSEEAMSNFARRDVKFRDVFDSAFDDIVNMRLLSLVDSQKIMTERVARLPRPFLAVCHVLGGGLARDLIREARGVFSVKQRGQDARLSDVVRTALERELNARRYAASVAVRELSREPDVGRFLHWLTTLVTHEDKLEAACAVREPWRVEAGASEDAQERAELARLKSLTREFQGFAYFSSTVLRFFVDSIGPDELGSDQHHDGLGGSVDDLAIARYSYGVNLAAAWEQTTTFRKVRGMPRRELPVA